MQTMQLPVVAHSRSIERVVTGVPTRDGAGVKLTRVLTADLQQRLDPFLMLDAFGSDEAGDYIAGFPDHPHRGFETVTYMIAGRMRHRDNAGHEGLLETGGMQWMTAGRGIVHSEMPEQTEGRMEGFQLWVNLPAARKMDAPHYQDIQAAGIPEFGLPGGGTLRLLGGRIGTATGAMQRPDTEPLFADIGLPAGAEVSIPVPEGHNAFIYVYRGQAHIGAGERPLVQQEMAILTPDGDGVRLSASVPARLILVSGQPLRQPIAQWGPFVMNTREEIETAIDDYRHHRF